ncbi:MAG: glycosyltransferase [Flavobacteriia bacterium]|nr:glycosyltransferase [Flavobacteriia bacterium]
MIKVCHLTSAHADGDIRIYHKECVSLAKIGYKVYHIVPNSISRITDENVNVLSFQVPEASRFKRMLRITKMVYRKALEVDAAIYHFHDPELLRYGLKLKRKGKIVIYDAHEDVPRQILGKPWIAKPLRKCISWLFEKYENYVAKRLSFVIVSTPTIRKRYEKVTTYTMDICNYPLLTENASEPDWALKKDEICYLGGLTEIRGVKEIIQSMIFVPDYRLNLAGAYSPLSFRDELVHLDGWKQVNELGFLNRKEVIETLNRSKVGLVTLYPQENYLDSLPIKMFEYMLAGIPVVASDFPLWKSIIEDAECGLCIDPKDPESIGEALQKILSDDTRAIEMGRKGRKKVLEEYNWGIQEQKLYKIYDRLLLNTNS